MRTLFVVRGRGFELNVLRENLAHCYTNAQQQYRKSHNKGSKWARTMQCDKHADFPPPEHILQVMRFCKSLTYCVCVERMRCVTLLPSSWGRLARARIATLWAARAHVNLWALAAPPNESRQNYKNHLSAPRLIQSANTNTSTHTQISNETGCATTQIATLINDYGFIRANNL